ncbi:glutaminase [Endozoicomonadaceae bacterium StTr2]
MFYQKILDQIQDEIQPLLGQCPPADYIPALAEADNTAFGMSVYTVEGEHYQVGAADTPFSIQSISKVYNLTLAMRFIGDDFLKRVGVEPSGTAFNSLSQLEYEHGIPRNPFINAGALVLTDTIISNSCNPYQVLLDFVRTTSGNETVEYDERVFQSEYDHGHRNAALVSYLRSFGNIKNTSDAVLKTYFYQCALKMSCNDLARSFSYLANAGRLPSSRSPIITSRQTRRINSLMMTCGTYDEAGEFAFHVGLPCKSGVGGGVLAVVPQKMVICAWSPGLNSKGNSMVATRALQLFTEKTGLSVF